MSQKRIGMEEIEDLLNAPDGSLYTDGRIPRDRSEREAYLESVRQRLRKQKESGSPSEGGAVAGTLRVYVVFDPDSWDYGTGARDHYLDDFTGSEWLALFKDELKCPMEIDQRAISSVDLTDPSDAYKSQFQKSIPDYPMLARMWNTYGDATYQPQEISRFRDECLKVKATTSKAVALQGLNKLLRACDEAVRSGCGLYLASD